MYSVFFAFKYRGTCYVCIPAQKRCDESKRDVTRASVLEQDPGSFDDLIQKTLLPKGVLIPKEAQALKNYTANKHKLLFTWSIIGTVDCTVL